MGTYRRFIVPFYPARRLRSTVVTADLDALSALRDLNDYRPHNPDHQTDAAAVHATALLQAREHEARIARTLSAARDAVQAAEWALHNAMLGVKAEVTAQYGANSDQVQAIGLKKKSDYRRPSRRPAVPARS
jgi:hypothetical protein